MVRSIVRAARIKGAQSHSCCGKHGGPRGYARTISRAVSLLQQSLSLLGRYRGGGDREVSKRGVIGEGKHAPQCLAQARRVSTMHCVRASAIFRDRATKFGRIEKLALRLAANAGDSAGANLGATRERVGDVLQEGVAVRRIERTARGHDGGEFGIGELERCRHWRISQGAVW